MEKRIILSTGEELLNILQSEKCIKCIDESKGKDCFRMTCPLDGAQKHIGFRETKNGCAWACDNKLTTRNFKIELQNVVDSIPQLIRFRKEIEKSIRAEERQRIDKVVHNLKTQNAHAIQELNHFIQNEQFAYDIQAVIPGVREIVKKKVHQASYTLLRLAKINSAMSDEIFIYEQIMNKDCSYVLNKRKYHLHDVLMLVFHEFLPDFQDKSVFVKVADYEERVNFDFTVIRFVFYHLIANAEKYVKPGSTLDVTFNEDQSFYNVNFKMVSYHMYSEDVDNMFKEGYSGKIAVEQKTAGQGLGMYLVKKMADMHKVVLLVTPGTEIKKVGKIEYSENFFKVSIPKS